MADGRFEINCAAIVAVFVGGGPSHFGPPLLSWSLLQPPRDPHRRASAGSSSSRVCDWLRWQLQSLLDSTRSGSTRCGQFCRRSALSSASVRSSPSFPLAMEWSAPSGLRSRKPPTSRGSRSVHGPRRRSTASLFRWRIQHVSPSPTRVGCGRWTERRLSRWRR